MFLSQQEVLKRLAMSHPTYNRLRRDGVLPGFFPGTKRIFWPQVVAALERVTGVKLDGTLARLENEGAPQA